MVSEMKNYFGGLMSRCDTAKESMNEFKDRSTETTKIVTQRENSEKMEHTFPELWDNIKWFNIHIIEVSGGEKMRGEENIWSHSDQR